MFRFSWSAEGFAGYVLDLLPNGNDSTATGCDFPSAVFMPESAEQIVQSLQFGKDQSDFLCWCLRHGWAVCVLDSHNVAH
jgi:hypothetical protein